MRTPEDLVNTVYAEIKNALKVNGPDGNSTGTLHYLLWNIIVNNKYAAENVTFAAKTLKKGFALVLISATEAEPFKTDVNFAKGVTEEQATGICAYLNAAIWAQSGPTSYAIIIASIKLKEDQLAKEN